MKLGSLRAAAPAIAADIAGLAGTGLVSAGVAMIYLPAGMIVLGTMLLAAAWLMARR